jgi:hypothetical protein
MTLPEGLTCIFDVHGMMELHASCRREPVASSELMPLLELNVDRPDTLLTLAEALRTNKLAPIERQRIRAQFSLLDRFQASDIRRAIALVLGRISAYYQVIAYTGPAYTYGRVDNAYPSALYAKPEHNSLYQTWSYREMSPTHPTCTIDRLFNEAGSMCIQTACKVAEAELSEEVPESKDLFRIAGRAIQTMVYDRDLSEVRWNESMRRLGTPGIRKILKRLTTKLGDAHIGWDRGLFAAVVPATCEWRLAQYPRVNDWSYGAQPVAEAC